MSNPYLLCLHNHARHAVKVMAQMSFSGLTEEEHIDIILATLQALHDSLQANMNKADNAINPMDRSGQLDQAAKMLESFIRCHENNDPTLQAALDLIRFWFPEGGAK